MTKTRNTMTRRAAPAAPESEVPMFDLGTGRSFPKGTPVRVAATETDAAFTGTLIGVDMRDGVPFTAAVWTGQKVRHVYVERLTVTS